MLTETELKHLRKNLNSIDSPLPIIFNALSDLTRFKIFCALLTNKELCVSDFAASLNISASAASQQLRLMELSGLIEKERMGQMVCYSLKKSYPLLKPFIKLIKKFSK